MATDTDIGNEMQVEKNDWESICTLYLDKGEDDFLPLSKKANVSNHNNLSKQLALTFQKCLHDEMYL